MRIKPKNILAKAISMENKTLNILLPGFKDTHRKAGEEAIDMANVNPLRAASYLPLSLLSSPLQILLTSIFTCCKAFSIGKNIENPALKSLYFLASPVWLPLSFTIGAVLGAITHAAKIAAMIATPFEQALNGLSRLFRKNSESNNQQIPLQPQFPTKNNAEKAPFDARTSLGAGVGSTEEITNKASFAVAV